MSRKPEKKGLGRGLSALLADVETPPADPAGSGGDSTRMIPIEMISANPDQPRQDFRERDLEDLTNSIKAKGIIQPLIVRKMSNDDLQFQIVAGERRWRAAQRAQLHEVPVIIRDLSDIEVLELAIIENVQRADLNPVEEAMGYRQLMDSFGHTQENLASALGKSRSHIANVLRLLTLPESVLTFLRAGTLSAGHARAMITAEDPAALARQVIADGLSVRQTEELAKAQRFAKPVKRMLKPAKDADTRALESDLTAHLRLKVSIAHKHGNKGGEVRISYRSLEELDGLCRLLSQ